jgi:nucleoside-triphosphatase
MATRIPGKSKPVAAQNATTMPGITRLVIMGKPGVGKTTLAARVVQLLRGRLRMAGFTTAEVRAATGERAGFDVVCVDGRRSALARAGAQSSVNVGRYGVNVVAFERIALPELARRDVDLMVIDEIGKMELSSARFQQAVLDALAAPVPVMATLGNGDLPFLEAIRTRPDVQLITVTERNRDALIGQLVKRFSNND